MASKVSNSPKKFIPIHPLVMAAYPILALAAANLGKLTASSAVWSLGVSLTAALVLWGIFRLVFRNWYSAAGLSTLFLILFFSYGHIDGLIFKEGDGTMYLSLVWGILLLAGGWWVVKYPEKIKSLTMPINVIAVVLLVFPLYSLIFYQFRSRPTPIDTIPGSFNAPISDIPEGELPDIYYIVLDGYARADVLADIYSYDNQPTLNRLRELGFYIANESYANYNQTFLSIPSSLNMDYITEIMDVEPDTSYDHDRHAKLIKRNQVDHLLTLFSYELVSFNSGHGLTAIVSADHYLRPAVSDESLTVSTLMLFGQPFPLTSFEALLLETTALRPVLPKLYQSMEEPPKYQRHRDRILYMFSHMADFAQAEGSYFTFAHLITPHPPFVFEADGTYKLHTDPYGIADGTHYVGHKSTREEYISDYRNQITYINTLLLDMVEEILTKSETPPIIILQADHGPGAYFDWHSLENTDHKERLSILNAYYFPGGDEGLLYSSITPVNTFRVVLNRYFDYAFELLDDRLYFSDWNTPYDFTEVTDRVR